MTDKDTEMLNEIISRTNKKDYTKFKLIINWEEYRETKRQAKVAKLICTALVKSFRKLKKNYLKAIKNIKIQDTDILASINVLIRCNKFYLQEIKTFKRMTNEYETYLLNGHFISSWFLLENRATEDMYNFTIASNLLNI